MVGKSSVRSPSLKKVFSFFLISLFLGHSIASAEDENPLDTVVGLDLNRYVGVWHQIVYIPNRFQKMCEKDTRAKYEVLGDGRIKVVNSCRDADSNLHVAKGIARLNAVYRDPARLQVSFAPAWLSFLPFVWGDYWVLDIDADYNSVLVGSPDRQYLWILARSPELAKDREIGLRQKASALGFDVTKLSE